MFLPKLSFFLFTKTLIFFSYNMSAKERKNVTDEKILYEFYSLDSFKYHIDMLSQLKLRIQQILPKVSHCMKKGTYY